MEIMEAVQNLDVGRRSMYDPDEIEEEQRDRERETNSQGVLRLLPLSPRHLGERFSSAQY